MHEIYRKYIIAITVPDLTYYNIMFFVKNIVPIWGNPPLFRDKI